MLKNLIYFFCLIVMNSDLMAQDQWLALPKPPVFLERSVAFTLGGFGYVGTGVGKEQQTNDFWRFDPKTDSWSLADSMPTLPRRSAFCFTINNKAYVGGGVNSLGLPDRSFWEYDPDQSQWAQKTNIPNVVIGGENTGGFSIGDKGYLLAAFNTRNFYLYNPKLDTWTPRTQFPGENKLYFNTFSLGGKGYVVAGFGTQHPTKDFWEYDPATNNWTQIADFPSPRDYQVTFTMGMKAYVGLGLAYGHQLYDFWEYNAETDTWLQIEGPGYSSLASIAMSFETKAYVGLGIPLERGPVFWEFTPKTSSIPDIETSHRINIFPNPVADQICFDLTDQRTLSYEIFCSNGQKLLSGNLSGNRLKVSSLSPGVYILKCRQDKEVYTHKFIKE